MMARSGIRDAVISAALAPRRLANALSHLVPGGALQGTTVIAVNGKWIKVVHAEGALGARRVTKACATAVPDGGLEDLQRALIEACASSGIVPRDVLVADPTHLCTVRFFNLPSTDPKEIRDIVELQAEKHTPYAKEEILTDFKVLDRDRAGYSRVMLVIAHQDPVHRAVRLVEGAGWTFERVGCELEGLIAWFRALKRPGAAKATDGASLIVDVDGASTTLLVMHRGQPQFHRSLSTGAEQLQEDPKPAGDRLVAELQRSIEALEAESGAPQIKEVLVSGGVERLPELKTAIERVLELPVTVVPFWPSGEAASPAPVAAGGGKPAADSIPDVSFTGLAGLAVGASEIDLTPQTTKLHHAFEARAKALVLLGCQCVAILVLALLIMIGRADKEKRYYADLKGVVRQAAPGAEQVQDALQQLGFVKDRLALRGQLLEAAETLATLSPEGVRWGSLAFSHNEQIVLKGVSEDLPQVYEFVAGLDRSARFSRVEATRVTKRKVEEHDVTDFEITCSLAPKEPA